MTAINGMTCQHWTDGARCEKSATHRYTYAEVPITSSLCAEHAAEIERRVAGGTLVKIAQVTS